MSETDLQVGIAVHHPAVHQRAERHRPVDKITDRVEEEELVDAGLVRRRGILMHEDQRTQFLRRLPERLEARVVIGLTVDVVVDHHAPQAEVADRPG